MEVSGAQVTFLFGCAGGLALELLRWWKLRESDQFPEFSKRWIYWALTIAMIIMGGLIAVAYGTDSTNAVLAMNLGASAPAIIGALATPPKGTQGGTHSKGFDGRQSGNTGGPSRLRRFLAFGA